MSPEVVQAIIAALGASGLAGLIVGGIVLTLVQRFLDRAERRFEGEITRLNETHKSMLQVGTTLDTRLREERTPVYLELWKEMAILPRYPRRDDVTLGMMYQFSVNLREWYFTKGGLYLSEQAKDAYLDVQASIWHGDHLEAAMRARFSEKLIDDEYYDTVRDKCSRLRTELTDDLLSRRQAPFLVGPDTSTTANNQR
ncbi:MAG TPA: hypothetical protein VF952_16255 [Chloroflexia bacterium]|jgi:hypothetical protein